MEGFFKTKVRHWDLVWGEYSWERWQPRDVFSLGLNERAAKIEHLYGSETACLECWYRLGKNDGFKLAKVATIPETDFNAETGKFGWNPL